MDIRLAPLFLSLYIGAWVLTAYGNANITGKTFAIVTGIAIILLVAICNKPKATYRTIFQNIATQLALIATAISILGGVIAWRQHTAAPLKAAISNSQVITVTGTVVSDPLPAKFGNGYTWEMQVTNSGRLRVTGPKVSYHERIEVTGKLTPNSTPKPGEKLLGRLTATTLKTLKRPTPFWRLSNTLRTSLVEVCAPLSPQAAGLVPGMAIGDTSKLPDDLDAAFRTAGLTHLTAVSGGHFAVILTAIAAISSAARPPKWVRLGTVVLASVGFVMLVRPGAAVVRAAAMCSVAVLGTSLGRKSASVPALCAGGSVLLLLDPWLARSYGFALSCAASAALMALSMPLARKITPWFGERFAFLVSVPVVAAAASAPILVLFTSWVSPYAVLANLLVSSAVAPTTLLALGATTLAPISPQLAGFLAKFAALGTGYLAAVANWVSGLPFARLPWLSGIPGALILLALFIGVGLLIGRWQPRGWPDNWRQFVSDQKKQIPRMAKAFWRRLKMGIPNRRDYQLLLGACLTVFSLLFVLSLAETRFILGRNDEIPKDWLVAFCDVGQGDAMVIHSGTNSGIVVDVGPDDTAMAKCLKDLNISKIELLVLSHYHADHIGGIRAALAGQKVQAAFVHDLCDEGTGVLEQLRRAGISAITPAPGQRGQIGKVAWQRLGEDFPTYNNCGTSTGIEDPEENNESLVMQFSIGELDIVALGDLEVPGQENLVKWLRITEPNYQNIEIVKVAHHGSAKQSPQLARLLAPKVAVYSSGAKNTFGHPTKKALELYEQLGAQTIRTDQCGTAVFATRNQNLYLTCLK